MRRRVLRGLWLVVAGVGGTVLGLISAALGTDAGRRIVVEAALDVANAALDGTVTIDDFDGSLLGGLEVRGLRVTGPDGDTLATVDTLGVRYRLRDLALGRIVLGQLSLAGARVEIVEGPDGRFNIARLVPSDTAEDAAGGPSPLIAFNDVQIARVTVTVRSAGAADPQRITIHRALLAYLRLSSPLPTERGILARVARLHADVSDPALAVRDAAGDVTVHGDTIDLALTRVRLPATRGALRGAIVPRADGLGLDLVAELATLDTDDLRGLVDLLPSGVTGRADVTVRTPRPETLRFDADNLDLRTPEGGRVTGRIAMTLGPGDRWRVDAADVTTRDFAVRHLEVLMDSIPFRGRLTGRTRAEGPQDQLRTRIDWRYSDDRVPGRPVTELVGDGTVGIGVPGDLVFRMFALERARVALATVRVLVPAVELQGRLDAVGTLDGAYRNAQFSGSLRHVHDTLPATVARGTVRIDGRDTLVGIWADLALDSLALAGWRPSYPALPLRGAFAGDLRFAGYLDALAFTADLAGPLGRVNGTGTIVTVPGRLGVRDLDLGFERIAVEQFRDPLPDTRLTGRARGALIVDSGRTPIVDLEVTLGASTVGGMRLDSAAARVRNVDGALRADTVQVWAHGALIGGAGGLAFRSPRRDSLRLRAEVDSLGVLLPLLEQAFGPDAVPDTVTGGLTARLAMTGALDTFALAVRVDGRRLGWDGIDVPVARLDVRWAGDRGVVEVDLLADTVTSGRLGFAALEARLSGRPDSLGWLMRSRIGEDAAVIAGGGFAADSGGRTVQFDSLAVLLVSSVWFLERGATIEMRDTAITLRNFAIAPRSGASRIAVDGVLPLRGPGDLSAEVERFSVPDLWALMQYDVRDAAGEVSGTGTLRGTARAPVIDASFALVDGLFGEFRAPRVEVTVAYADRRLEMTGGLWRLGEEIMHLDGALPLDLALRGAGDRRVPGPLTVRARADGVDLAFTAALYPQIRNTSGRLWADFGITGTWQRPQLTGEIRVEDGAATFPALGVRHERLNGRITLSGDTIHVRNLSIRSGGTAELAGFVRLEGLTAPVLGLTLSAQDFRAVEIPELVSATVSGEVRLRGPVVGARLSGRTTIPRGTVWFGDIVGKNIINLEDTLFAEVVDREMIRRQGLGQEFQNRFLDSLRIDSLILEMGNDVALRSSEATIGLTGTVLINKVAAQYRLDGSLSTPRGTYRLPLAGEIEKEFTVTRGEVRYFGTADLNAALDIDARHELRSQRGERVTIFVHIGGTIEAPTLVLSSDIQPPISDTEIISYLLVGAPSVQAGSAGLVGQVSTQYLEQITARVTGRFTSTLISDLSLPLDYIEFRPDFGGGGVGEIAVGRRFGERIIVSVSPRICAQELWTYRNLGASIEFRMTQELRLSASADPVNSCRLLGGEGSDIRYQLGFDVFWEQSY